MSDSPEWAKLPGDPAGFFGLDAGFGRQDLKRRYNALIKRFKPEKHPQEFQRIRAAFEMLDGMLRYGAGGTSFPLTGSIAAAGAETLASGGGRSSVPIEVVDEARVRRKAVVRWIVRLAETSPAAVVREIQESPEKKPHDYWVLATIADSLDGADPLAFVKWILAGIKQTRSPQLVALLIEYLRSSIPDALLAKVLIAVSQVVNDDRFFFCTERIWDRVVQLVDFGMFRELLARCERNLRDHRNHGRVIFIVHIVRRVLFKASDRWLSETMEFVNQNVAGLPWIDSHELEIIDALVTYHRGRSQVLNGDPLLEAMDETIQKYCAGDDDAFDRAFIACQLRIAGGEEVLSAFSIGNDSEDAYSALYHLWRWLDAEVAMRMSNPPSEIPPDVAMKSLTTFARTMEFASFNSLAGKWWTSRRGYHFGQLIVGAVLAALFAGIGGRLWILAAVSVAITGYSAYRLVPSIRQRDNAATSLRFYQREWRRKMVSLFRRMPVDPWSLQEMLAHPKFAELASISWTRHYMGSDYGLAIFACAQKYVL